MRLAAAQPCEREAVADLDALHRLDAHHRRGEPRVEPLRLRRVRAEPRRDTGRAHLDHAADGVAVGARLVDSRAKRVLVDDRPAHRDPDRREQRLRDRAGRDVHRGVPRARALERVARIVEAVLERAREVGVPRPRQRHRLRALARRLALRRPRAHPPLPVRVVAVADDERERRPERAPVPEPREHLDLVLLDLLARAAAVALLPAAQVGVDRFPFDDEARGQALRGSRRAQARATPPQS